MKSLLIALALTASVTAQAESCQSKINELVITSKALGTFSALVHENDRNIKAYEQNLRAMERFGLEVADGLSHPSIEALLEGRKRSNEQLKQNIVSYEERLYGLKKDVRDFCR